MTQLTPAKTVQIPSKDRAKGTSARLRASSLATGIKRGTRR